MIVSVTEREHYKRCRRQWHFQSYNRLSLAVLVPTPALDLGGLIHSAHEGWINDPETPAGDHLLGLASDSIDKLREDYRKIVGMEITEDELGPKYAAASMGNAMMANYQAYWKSPIPEGFTMLRVEQSMVVEVPGTEHEWEWLFHRPDETDLQGEFRKVDCHLCEVCERVGWDHAKQDADHNFIAGTKLHRHSLEGKLDGFLQHIATGDLYILERKTYGNRPNAETLASMDQFLAYIWMVEQLHLGRVGGIAYDGMWKRETPPKGKTMDDLFLRCLLDRPRAEIDEFGLALAIDLLEMGSSESAPMAFMNKTVPWLGCRDCNSKKLCDAVSRGEDWRYIRRKFYTLRDKDGREELWPEDD